MKENVLLDKSFAFAVRTVDASKFLTSKKKEFVLSRQWLRSGTSIGANVEESVGGQSELDLLSKLSIAYKEARETRCSIKLLHATNYLSDLQADSLFDDIDELLRIIGKIQITTKNKNNQSKK